MPGWPYAQLNQNYNNIHDHEKVSIIVPCYNYGRFLKNCIDSILAQTYQNIEVIVINDGSTDQTSKILQSYNSKIHAITNFSFNGVGAARNQGLSFATGRLCLFVDADDYLEPFFLERTVPVIQQSKAGIVYSGFRQIFTDRSKNFIPIPYQRHELMKENYMAVTSLTITDLVKKVGGFDNNLLIQDYDLWLRITHIAPAVGILEPLWNYVMHGNNGSLMMPQERRLREVRRIRRRITFGIFLQNKGSLFLVTSAKVKHSLPPHLLFAMGLDEKDVFTVEQSILDQYATSEPITSINAMMQTAAAENSW